MDPITNFKITNPDFDEFWQIWNVLKVSCCFSFFTKQSDRLNHPWKFWTCSFGIGCWIRWARYWLLFYHLFNYNAVNLFFINLWSDYEYKSKSKKFELKSICKLFFADLVPKILINPLHLFVFFDTYLCKQYNWLRLLEPF